MRHILATSIFSMILAGCSATPKQSVSTFYDYQLYSPQASALSVQKLPASIRSADVILIGEWHTHSGIHRFQTDLLKALSQSNDAIALSMEQFSRDKQSVVDQYLAGKIGEQMLIKTATRGQTTPAITVHWLSSQKPKTWTLSRPTHQNRLCVASGNRD